MLWVCDAHINIMSVRLTQLCYGCVRLTHINIMSVRLTQLCYVCERLTVALRV